MHRFRTVVLAATLAALAAAVPAAAAPHTTVSRTIQDRDGDNLLDAAPGEDYVVLDANASADKDDQDFRPPRDGSILNFLQLSDFQMVDEESPARVEFLDFTQRGLFAPFSSAYRPQESLTTQVTESMVRQARNTTSPVTGERLELSVLTGDNADSQQYNETRWFVDILDGTTGARPPGLAERIDPNSGVPTPGCEATPGTIYDGVRDGGETGPSDDGYYEPDSSSGERDDGDGYNPRREDNMLPTEANEDVTVRDFPGLLERANQQFEALGLDMPWYSAFGNHDALVQGNSPEAYFGPGGTTDPPESAPLPATEKANPIYQAIATGCVKVKRPSGGTLELIRDLEAQIEALKENGELPSFASLEDAVRLAGQVNDKAFEELAAACADAGAESPECREAAADFGGSAEIVPPDEERCFLAKDEIQTGAPFPCRPRASSIEKGPAGSWITQHFFTSGTPVGHGFAPTSPADCRPEQEECEGALTPEERGAGLGRPREAVKNHDGYYSFSPREGLRFVVLDTITDECGSEFCSEGSVDDEQFQWLRRQIEQAAKTGQHVLVFSHHTLRTTRQPSADLDENAHYGQRVDRMNPANPQSPSPNETLEELYCQHPNVLGHVNGHEHENFVLNHRCEQAQTEEFPPFESRNFYEISTAAHIDYPQQSRMLELVKNEDDTISLVLTMLDHDGPADPGGARPCEAGAPPSDPDCEDARGQAGDQVLKLSSIGRELAYNDYQASRGARGDPTDRNVIIKTNRPFPYPADPGSSDRR